MKNSSHRLRQIVSNISIFTLIVLMGLLTISCSADTSSAETAAASPTPTSEFSSKIAPSEFVQVSNQPTPTARPTTVGPPRIMVQSSLVNLHAGPGEDYDIIGEAELGEEFDVLAKSGGWYNILLSDGERAWVAEITIVRLSDLRGVEEAATVPAAPDITRSPATEEPPVLFPSPTVEPTEEVEDEDDDDATVQTAYVVTYVPPTPVLNTAGLGQLRSIWESNHIITAVNYYPTGSAYNVYDDLYDILFADDRVWAIRMSWDPETAITAEAAETLSRRLIPTDSRLVETYSPADRPHTIVNLYHSRSLEYHFLNQGWPGGIPGDFIVQYDLNDHGVSSMAITLGNNP